MPNREIFIKVTVDWEDYEDVIDELVIEDVFPKLPDGVSVEIVPNETQTP